MTPAPLAISVDHVCAQLQRLRRGPALGHPGAVLALSEPLRACLFARQRPINASGSDVLRLVAALRQAVDALNPHERLYAAADFNLLPEHCWPTLNERQESLARLLGCSAKTVRRHSRQALDTLAVIITDGSYLTATQPVPDTTADTRTTTSGPCRFFGISATSPVDIVCSDLPTEHPGGYRPANDPLYSRYRLFADLDALIYVRVHLAQEVPTATIRDFHLGEYYGADADTVIILGAPERNAKYADLIPHLPYRFGPYPEGGLYFPNHTEAHLAPLWTPEGELLSDLSVIARLTLTQGTTVTLLGGCLTLGVLGAAKALINGTCARRNLAHLAGEQDIITVNRTRKIGGITDTADFTVNPPLLALVRHGTDEFTTAIDHTRNNPDPVAVRRS